MASNEELGRAVLELTTDSSELNKGVDSAKDKASELEGSFKNAADMIKNAFAAIGVGFSLKEVLNATIEAEHEAVLLAAAVRSTGQAAGYTTEQLKAQQVVLQQSTGIGDEAISKMQRTLMSFRNVHGEVFRSTIQLSLDFAAATGGDATDAARKFGLALNDPINNMGLLKRAGVSLSDTLKQQVEDLVNSGNLVGAQTLLIKEISKAYSGAAVAARDTLGGALVALKENFANLFLEQEGAGKQLRILIELMDKSLPTAANAVAASFATLKVWIEGVETNIFFLGKSILEAIKIMWEWAKILVNPLSSLLDYRTIISNVSGQVTELGDSLKQLTNPISLAGQAAGAGALAWEASANSIRSNTTAANELASTAPVAAETALAAAEQMRAAAEKASNERMAQSAKEFDAMAALGEKNSKEINARMKRLADEDKARNAQKISDLRATFGAIETLSQSHNQALLIIGKSAGIAQATIDTFIGVGRALALGPIAGPPLAALVLAAGLANVARIAGVKGLETGGPMKSGETALVGEAGPELFTAPRAGHIVPNGEFGGSSGMVVTNNINVEGLDFSSESTASRILMAIADAAKRGTESAIPAANAFNTLASANFGRAV